MPRKVRSILALLMLTLFLGTGAAQALPAEGPSSDRGPGMLDAIWDWVSSLLEVDVPFLQVQEAALPELPPPPKTDGCFIDPNGGE